MLLEKLSAPLIPDTDFIFHLLGELYIRQQIIALLRVGPTEVLK